MQEHLVVTLTRGLDNGKLVYIERSDVAAQSASGIGSSTWTRLEGRLGSKLNPGSSDLPAVVPIN